MGGKPIEINPTTRLKVISGQVINIEHDDVDTGETLTLRLTWMDALELGAKLITYGTSQLRRFKR